MNLKELEENAVDLMSAFRSYDDLLECELSDNLFGDRFFKEVNRLSA